MNAKRIICVGRIRGGWLLESKDTHPLPPSARKQLEALWPTLEAAPVTPEQAEAWFIEHYPQEAGT